METIKVEDVKPGDILSVQFDVNCWGEEQVKMVTLGRGWGSNVDLDFVSGRNALFTQGETVKMVVRSN